MSKLRNSYCQVVELELVVEHTLKTRTYLGGRRLANHENRVPIPNYFASFVKNFSSEVRWDNSPNEMQNFSFLCSHALISELKYN